MITSTVSREFDANPDFKKVERRRGEDNLQWLRRLNYTPKGFAMLLVGGKDPLSFRLRVAQAHLRHDMTPSAWSHVALVMEPNRKEIGRSKVSEISLDPERGFGWAPEDNAVQENVLLGRYRDPDRYPNVAVMDLPPENASGETAQHEAVTQALARFKKTRGTLDCCELTLQWLAFAWGAGQVPNPLFAGRGIPSAVLVESLAAATGFELTPGIDSRASCPEAVYQGAKWWYGLHDKVASRRLVGAYFVAHELVS